MVEIHFHPEARIEYRNALTWYHRRSEEAAERFEQEFENALERILATPLMFPLHELDVRSVMLDRFPYLVVYLIEVIAVARTRRNQGYWRDRI